MLNNPLILGPDKPLILRIDALIFYATFQSREDAEKLAGVLSGVVRDYGVLIQSNDPYTGEVTRWEKTEGFSVWTKTLHKQNAA